MPFTRNFYGERQDRNFRKKQKQDAKLRAMEEAALQRKLAKLNQSGDLEMRPAHKCVMRDR